MAVPTERMPATTLSAEPARLTSALARGPVVTGLLAGFTPVGAVKPALDT